MQSRPHHHVVGATLAVAPLRVWAGPCACPAVDNTGDLWYMVPHTFRRWRARTEGTGVPHARQADHRQYPVHGDNACRYSHRS